MLSGTQSLVLNALHIASSFDHQRKFIAPDDSLIQGYTFVFILPKMDSALGYNMNLSEADTRVRPKILFLGKPTHDGGEIQRNSLYFDIDVSKTSMSKRTCLVRKFCTLTHA